MTPSGAVCRPKPCVTSRGSRSSIGMTSPEASDRSNVLSEPPSRVKVGEPRNFEEGKVVDSFKDRGFWIVRYEGKIYALSTTCTHLGCTPNWLEADKKFKCPCHGSGFYITGVNFEGPAPRPLERWAIGEEEGQLVVDKSKKFQRELGQWDNPESYYKV